VNQKMEKDKYLNISRPNKTCLSCGKSLVEIEKHPTILTNEEVARMDFCEECWEKYKDKDYFSFWITKRIVPDSKQSLTKKERNDLLLRLFESLYQDKAMESSYILFYLAHLLMRYKIFNWKGTRSEPKGGEEAPEPKEFLVFENKYTGEEILIPDQELNGEKVSESKSQIDEYLKTHLPEETNQKEKD